MSDQRRRRTQSAGEAELSMGLTTPITPPETNRQRRRSNARQARLILFPSQPVFQQSSVQPQASIQTIGVIPRIPQNPAPVYKKNTISFTLLPGRADIKHTFKIEKKTHQSVSLVSYSQIAPLSFSINQTVFNAAVLPVDITSSICHGMNNIVFMTINQTSTVYVDISFNEPRSMEMLLHSIIYEYPPPNELPADPFSTKICPISGEDIDKPSRGVNCSHAQCFDLKAFLERGMMAGDWTCPVCGTVIPIEDIRYDPKFSPGFIQFGTQDDLGEFNPFDERDY